MDRQQDILSTAKTALAQRRAGKNKSKKKADQREKSAAVNDLYQTSVH